MIIVLSQKKCFQAELIHTIMYYQDIMYSNEKALTKTNFVFMECIEIIMGGEERDAVNTISAGCRAFKSPRVTYKCELKVSTMKIYITSMILLSLELSKALK